MFDLHTHADRMRKLAEDSADSLRNSKSLASMVVHEDGNPVSIGSCCYEKCNDSEINSTGEEQSEKPDLESTGECHGDWETNGSSSSKDAEKLAIEKIIRGPFDAHRVFSEEPHELEDGLVKDFGENMKNSNFDSSNSEPIIPKKETASATCLYSNGGVEENLEVNLLM